MSYGAAELDLSAPILRTIMAGSVLPGAPAKAGTPTDAYTVVSDVDPHAALGRDLAAIRVLLAPAKEGGTVDWAAIGTLFREGKASKKGDGSLRTLASLSPDSAAVPLVESAGRTALNSPEVVTALGLRPDQLQP